MARRRGGPAHPMELVFLPGLAEVVAAEVGERLGPAVRLRPVLGVERRPEPLPAWVRQTRR